MSQTMGRRELIGVAAAAVSLCLDAAKEQAPGLETELVELADLSIPAQL
ncbi:MAG: hypothetical protein GWP08_00550, partial [Nitrospiraceae bacterium]|nr:hypothetical protein [Nitrospiraceae bacterium]